MNVVLPFELFAKVCAHKLLLSQFSSKCSPPQTPVEISIEVHTIYIGSVVVVRIFLRCATEKLESVHAAIPIDRRTDVEPSLLVFSLQGSESLERMFKLVIVFCRIERVCTKVFNAHSGMPVHRN